MALKTDYKDFILPAGEDREFNVTQNPNGTTKIIDVSIYDQNGEYIGAGVINATNLEVNLKRDKTDPVFNYSDVADSIHVKGIGGSNALLGTSSLTFNDDTGATVSLARSSTNMQVYTDGALYVRGVTNPSTYKNVHGLGLYTHNAAGTQTSYILSNTMVIGNDTDQQGYNLLIRGSATDPAQTTVQVIRQGQNMLVIAESEIMARKQSSNGVYIPVRASAFPTSSSRRYKTDIKNLDSKEWGNKFSKLVPKTFYLKDDTEKKHLKYGFIAEEVEKIAPELVMYNEENMPDALNYMDLIAIQHLQLQEQEKRIDKLETELEEIKAMLKGK